MEQQAPRKIKIDLETFVKRSWPILVLGAVLVIFASAALMWFAVSGKARKQAGDVRGTESSATSTPRETDLVGRSLDGAMVTPAEANLQAYAVMIENTPEARPTSGLSKANLVYELPVEGGVTRYMAVFDATTTVDQIGPVRSARAYYVDFADGLNALYAHVGGSPEALDKIKATKGFRDLNEFFYGKYFWRSSKRAAPHNTYTRSDLLRSAEVANKIKPGKIQSWKYKDDEPAESTGGLQRGSENGPTLAFGGSYGVSWKYDRDANEYVRSLAGAEHKDADGTAIKSKNIVVLTTEWSAVDDKGRLKLRTTGKGSAVLYRDGKKLPVIWRRVAGEHLKFEGVDGTDVFFNRGTTWLEFTQSKPVVTTSTKDGTTATSTKP